jgi:hypothetical protein
MGSTRDPKATIYNKKHLDTYKIHPIMILGIILKQSNSLSLGLFSKKLIWQPTTNVQEEMIGSW